MADDYGLGARALGGVRSDFDATARRLGRQRRDDQVWAI